MPTLQGGPGVSLSREDEIRRMGAVLHDLCQPLTTLQCRLEMAQQIATPQAYRDAVDAGMIECARLSAAVNSMREVVRAVTRRTAEDQDETPEAVNNGGG